MSVYLLSIQKVKGDDLSMAAEVDIEFTDDDRRDDDDEAEEEAATQRPLRDPGSPSRREILEHNLTHIPPRPWCPHCVRGKGKDSPSLRLTDEYAENLIPRVRLDYCFLTESYGEEQTEETRADGQTENLRLS